MEKIDRINCLAVKFFL